MTTSQTGPAMRPAASWTPPCIGRVEDPDCPDRTIPCVAPAVALVETMNTWGHVREGGCCALHLANLEAGARDESGMHVALKGVRELRPEAQS